jgi:transcription antitermination factor NusG
METGSQNTDESRQKLWYAIHVRSRFESQMSTVLRSKGYEEFLPTYRCKHRWSDRAKELDLPLFPGYLFSRFDVCERLPILKSPGLIAIVGLGKAPIPIPDEEIEAIRAIVRSGLPVEPWPHLTVGSRVFVEAGPLAGLEGNVVNIGKTFRLVVSVSLLQRSVRVEIERSWVRPVARNHFREKTVRWRGGFPPNGLRTSRVVRNIEDAGSTNSSEL